MSHERDTVIQGRLNKMTKWAEQRRNFLRNPPEWWREDFYIRIGGNGYTAVSLSDSSPLLGFGSGTSKNIDTLEKHFAKKPNGAIKSEKRAQAWLIKQALNNKVNKLDFKESLGLRSNDIYEKLFFALDEVSMGDRHNKPINRTDIIAVGIYSGVAYPVLIELKYGRHLTGKNDLLPQLEEYAAELKKFEREFKPLLHACVGIDVNLSRIGKIMVWPESPSGEVSDSVERCYEQKVTIIESNSANWSDNIAFLFHPFNKVYPPVPYINEE